MNATQRFTTRIVESEGSRVLQLSGCHLTVSSGPDQGKSAAAKGPLLRVGTSSENDLVLTDNAASARHFEIELTEQGPRLRDLGSTNGTRVGGIRCVDGFLDGPVDISVGETTLRFEPGEDSVDLPLSNATNFGGLLGHSPTMQAAFSLLERCAKTDSTVLVLGESGTGKELAARGLHENSARSEGPYIVFDCGAVSPNLLESQLFGHAKGAFTGATEARAGAFEQAHGGTLVFDELGELPLDLQPKLLRCVEGKQVQRVGETTPRPVDVRIVACTNRNLEEEVRENRFREDLFFRLSVLTVMLPPLRQRPEEIPRLAAHFLTQLGAAQTHLDSDVQAMLAEHGWPGNVRELRNVIERLVVMPDAGAETLLGTSARKQTSEQSLQIRIDIPFHEAKRTWTDELERNYLSQLLRECGGNVSEVARRSGLSRQSCHRLIQKHGLSNR